MVGVLDIGGLADCLIGMYQGKADAEILDKWAEIRRGRVSITLIKIGEEHEEITKPGSA